MRQPPLQPSTSAHPSRGSHNTHTSILLLHLYKPFRVMHGILPQKQCTRALCSSSSRPPPRPELSRFVRRLRLELLLTRYPGTRVTREILGGTEIIDATSPRCSTLFLSCLLTRPLPRLLDCLTLRPQRLLARQ